MKLWVRVVNRLVLAAMVTGMLMFAKPGFSATATTNLAVTAQVDATCTVTTSALAFGNYDPISTHATSPLDGTGTVTVKCANGLSAVITLGQGSYPDSGSTDASPLRRLSDGSSSYLSYSLYQDGSRATTWGNTSGTGVSTTGTGSDDSHTVYGRIPGGQGSVDAGSYSDTVVVTVTF